MADHGGARDLPAIDDDECPAHRMVRLAVFLADGAVAAAAWGVVAWAVALHPVLVVAGVVVVPFVATVVLDVVAGGSPVRRLVGLRVADADTLGNPTLGGAVRHELMRVLTLMVGDSLVTGGSLRRYDARSGRRTVVVGRPTGPRVLAGLLVVTAVVALAWAAATSADIDTAWAAPIVASVVVGALSVATGLAGAAGLASLPPPPGERVSRLTVGGEWTGVDADLSLGLTGVRVAGSLDATPVGRPRSDGTVAAEVLESESGFVTRKRRRVGRVAEPQTGPGPT